MDWKVWKSIDVGTELEAYNGKFEEAALVLPLEASIVPEISNQTY